MTIATEWQIVCNVLSTVICCTPLQKMDENVKIEIYNEKEDCGDHQIMKVRIKDKEYINVPIKSSHTCNQVREHELNSDSSNSNTSNSNTSNSNTSNSNNNCSTNNSETFCDQKNVERCKYGSQQQNLQSENKVKQITIVTEDASKGSYEKAESTRLSETQPKNLRTNSTRCCNCNNCRNLTTSTTSTSYLAPSHKEDMHDKKNKKRIWFRKYFSAPFRCFFSLKK